MSQEVQRRVKDFRNEADWDSEGCFSVEADRALLQLDALHGAEPGLWLLRLLQAAAACRSTRIEIQEGLRGIQICCRDYHTELLDERLLLKRLSDPLGKSSSQLAVEYLHLSLRASLAQRPKRLEVSLAGIHLILEGNQLLCQDGPLGVDLKVVFEPERSSAWPLHTLKRLTGQTPERKALRTRTQFYPGCLHGVKPPSRSGFGSGNSAQSWLGQVHPQGADYLAMELLLTGRDTYTQDRLSSGARIWGSQVYRSNWSPQSSKVLVQKEVVLNTQSLKRMGHSTATRGNDPPLLARLRLPLRMQGPTRVILVRHGVQCNACELEMGWPGLEIVLTAPKLKLDLSQWSLVISSQLRQLLESLRQPLQSALLESKGSLRRLPAGYQARLQSMLPWLVLTRPARPASPPRPERRLQSSNPLTPPRDQPPPVDPNRPRHRPFRR